MIDVGLVVSLLAAGLTLAVLRRWAPPLTVDGDELAGACSAPLWAGIAGARIAAVALDDPNSFARPRDLLLVRSGMEFWAGALAALVVAAVYARRGGIRVSLRLADLAVYGLVAYGTYEAMCLVRDGCFGPASSLGLSPRGSGRPEVPVGVLVAIALWALAASVRPVVARSPERALALAAGGTASVRLVASLFLPRISTGLARVQVEALVVTAVALAALVVGRLAAARRGAHEDLGPGRGEPPPDRSRSIPQGGAPVEGLGQ